MGEKEAMWNLWKAPIRKFKCRPLRFTSKAMPLATMNFTPFMKQLLAYKES